MDALSSIRRRTLALFEKRIAGDDALMELARLRFQQAGMGAEIYAANPEQLDWAIQFCPAGRTPVVAHLSRDINLADNQGPQRIEDFARRFAGRVQGLVIHDHPALADNPQGYRDAAVEMDSRLRQISDSPWLFVEYATGLELQPFVDFFEAIRQLDRISACVDVGHVGIHEIRNAYARVHPGVDVCALKRQPAVVPQVMPDLAAALASALPAVLELVEQIGTFAKPVHFHLHDGHPLSVSSPFGVSDHLSFLAEIPLNFNYRGRDRAGLMFGPDGLFQIIARAIQAIGPERVSFTMEIHPTFERLPLGDAASLFGHWRDKTNAEIMNHWLTTLGENHHLLCQAIEAAIKATTPAAH